VQTESLPDKAIQEGEEAIMWRRFAGQSIFNQFTKNPWSDTMEKLLPDFEKQTGIKVEFSELPEIVGVTEYRDIIGVAIQKAIEGAKSEVVLAQAQKEFQEVLDKTEK
jgi:ABC-type glycerol-3-phosphate transport system substrate-binding protein